VQIDSFTTGSTRKRVSRANLGSIRVPVPDIHAQKRFVSISKQSDKSKFELQKALDELTAMQKKLMLNIFSEQ
jgi:type I restriction enzyme S subunit